MKLPDVELSELRYFHTVALAQSFAEGARRAHVSPPAVSKAIKKLEETLGAEVFDRSGRTVALTPAGEVLFAHATEVLQALERLGVAVAESGDTLRGELRVGTTEEFAAQALPLAVVRLAAEHPALVVRTFLMGPAEISRRLRDGDLDVGLASSRAEISESLQPTPLVETPLSIVCGRSHPLFEACTISASALSEHPFVVPQFYGQEHPADGYPHDAPSRVVGASAELVQMAIQMVIEGPFLGYFPDVMIRCQLNHRELWRLDGIEASSVELVAIRRPQSARSAAVDVFLEKLRTTLIETLNLECDV